MLSAFAFALRDLPLAEAYSLFFIAPLLVTALAVPLLGERVGWRRWAAIVVGLGGVLVIVCGRMQRAWSLSAALPYLSQPAAYSLSAITVRILGRTDSTQSMVFWMIVLLSLFAVAAAWKDWTPCPRRALADSGGPRIQRRVRSVRSDRGLQATAVSVVAPFEYTALAWGIGFDWMIWSTLPDRTDCCSAPPSSSPAASTSSGVSEGSAARPDPFGLTLQCARSMNARLTEKTPVYLACILTWARCSQAGCNGLAGVGRTLIVGRRPAQIQRRLTT